MSIHYNPETRPNLPMPTLYDRGLVSKGDRWYAFHMQRAYPSREDLLKANFTGPAYWMQNGGLHKGNMVGSWDFKPVTKDTEPVFSGGINWGNAYFTTEAAAKAWIADKATRYDIYYEKTGDVWCVHYHY